MIDDGLCPGPRTTYTPPIVHFVYEAGRASPCAFLTLDFTTVPGGRYYRKVDIHPGVSSITYLSPLHADLWVSFWSPNFTQCQEQGQAHDDKSKSRTHGSGEFSS